MTRFIAMFVFCVLAAGGASTRPTARPSMELQGGASTRPTARPSMELQAKAATETYIDCLYARADSLAKGTGSPSDIADAALADCAREYNAYRSAVSDYFASTVSRQGESNARARADAHSTAFRDDARRAIVSRVLRALAPLGLSAQATKAKTPVDDPEKERLLVEDYKALCLWVDAIIARDNRTNLTTETLRNQVEVRLRSAGISPIDVLDNLSVCTDPRRTDGRYLQVSVHFQGNAFRVNVDFVRHAAWWVSKSPDDVRGGPVATRQDLAIGTHNGNAAPVMEAVDAILDQFLNAYLKANQK